MRVVISLIGIAASLMLNGQNQLDDQGRKTGPWKVDYPNGKTLYEATFKEGRPIGEMIRYHENGAVRARMMFDTLENRSYTTLYYKNGKQAAEGWYENKVKDSVWTYFSQFDGTVRIREPYLEGRVHGMVRSFYPNGNVSEAVSWQNNQRQGEWKRFYSDGSHRLIGHYENDLLNGTYAVFYPDSTLKMKGMYVNNLSEGKWRFYDHKGIEIYTIEYRLGKAIDREEYLKMIQDSINSFKPITEPESLQHF